MDATEGQHLRRSLTTHSIQGLQTNGLGWTQKESVLAALALTLAGAKKECAASRAGRGEE